MGRSINEKLVEDNIYEFKKTLSELKFENFDESLSEIIHKNYRVPFFKKIFKDEKNINNKLLFYKLEKEVKINIEDSFFKNLTLSLSEKKHMVLKDCLKKSVSPDFNSLLEVQFLLKSILNWHLNIERLNNLLIKLNFYSCDITEKMKKKCIKFTKNKKKAHFTFKNYLSIFFLKTLTLLVNNLSFPGFSKGKIIQFALIIITAFGGSDIMTILKMLKTYHLYIPLFLTTLNIFKGFFVKKISHLIDAEELKIYSKITAEKMEEYNAFQKKIINRLENELDFFIAFKKQGNDLKVQDSKIIILRILENYLLQKSYKIEDYTNIFEKNFIKVEEKDGIIYIDKIENENDDIIFLNDNYNKNSKTQEIVANEEDGIITIDFKEKKK